MRQMFLFIVLAIGLSRPAAVAAADPDAAEEALELIQVEYEPLTTYGNMEEALAAGGEGGEGA